MTAPGTPLRLTVDEETGRVTLWATGPLGTGAREVAALHLGPVGSSGPASYSRFGPSRMVLTEQQPPEQVPAEVLLALASAWEDQAERAQAAAEELQPHTPTAASLVADARAMANCARMLREAIDHGGEG